MLTELRFFQKSRNKTLILLFVITASLCSYVCAGQRSDISEPPKYSIYSLANIPAEKAVEFLSQAGVGTVSKLPGLNTLLITASPNELIKATAILKLVDAKEQFAIKKFSLPAGLDKLPSNEQLAAKLGDISIGTFVNPPITAAANRAIVDIYNGAVVVIAPANLIERIISLIGKPTALEEAAEKVTAEPEKPPAIPTKPVKPKQITIEPAAVEQKQPSEITEPAVTHRYEPPPVIDGNEPLKLQLPETLSIIDLLGLVGEYLKLDFMYDPAQIQGNITLKLHGKLRGDLRIKDLYPLLESVLKFRGFVMTRRPGNIVVIVPIAQALDNDPVLLSDEKGMVERGDIIVSRAFQLQFIDTTKAINLLTAMKLTTTAPIPVPEIGMLLVTDYAHRMPRIEELLEIIDKPGKPKEFRFRQLRFTMAKTLSSKVKTLSDQLGTVSITVAAQTPTTPTPAVRRPPIRRPTPPIPSPTPTAPSVYLDADERTNRILMIGYAEELDVVEQLIDSLDVEQQDLRTMKLYKIQNIDAEEAKRKMQELGIIGGGAQATTTRPLRITAPAGRPEAPPTAQPAGQPSATTALEAPLEEPQVIVIEMTNSLLVNATAEQHVQIEQILKFVDSRTEEEEIPYKIYPLENQKPEDLATVLNQLIKQTIQDKEGKVQQVIKKTEEEIEIIADENTFSLIVYASKKNQEWIASLIKQLDKRRPQVLIDVTLVEISKTDSFDYDLNLVESFPDLTNTSGLIADFNNIVSKLVSSGRDRYIDVQSKGGIGTGFYGDKHINALLTAMQTKGYGRVLAKPKILVNDNETGTIKTTDTTYVTKKSSTPIGTAATGQQITSIETAVSYEPYDAGITLDITPHISEGKLLRLDITLSRSDFTSAVGEKPPDKTASDITTTVTVPDGSTIILGGMLKLNQAKGGTKVPLLGDIPLVGGLFRSINNSDLQRKLYVFVKAEIIRPAESTATGLADLERISERNRLAFEKHEAEFQKYQDWPGIKPKPIAPVKVLETE